MSALLADLRDLVYTRLGVKKAALEFVNNGFTLVRTWKPEQALDDLNEQHPNGKLYVMGGQYGDINTRSRTDMTLQEFPVMLTYQKFLAGEVNDEVAGYGFVDDQLAFIEEIVTMLRKEIGTQSNAFSFSRLEYAKDENGIPLDFVVLDRSLTFECILVATFNRPLA